ncbi:MAG: hypothetical protein R3331_07085 [Sulfurospirillaceae bacterium]|nr:hypothetical protein [Sulfurospirillaceae bacterium]
MQTVDHISGIMWLCSWPVLIYAAYKFIVINIHHFEENILK